MIIIVDDTTSNQAVMKRMLVKSILEHSSKEIDESELNKNFVSFTTGQEAINYIEKNKDSVTLIILDGNLAQPMLTDPNKLTLRTQSCLRYKNP